MAAQAGKQISTTDNAGWCSNAKSDGGRTGYHGICAGTHVYRGSTGTAGLLCPALLPASQYWFGIRLLGSPPLALTGSTQSTARGAATAAALRGVAFVGAGLAIGRHAIGR